MSEQGNDFDDDTIRLAASGDRDAQRQIYEFFGDRVYRTVHRIVGNTDADDVMQDVFIRLFDKLPSFRFESAFSTWLHRLVINEALQCLRKRGRKSMTIDLLQHQELELVNRSHFAIEVVELMARAMEQIEPELRRIFELKVVDELTYLQIGEIVGIPEGTVGSRLNRARRELRDQLFKLGWEA